MDALISVVIGGAFTVLGVIIGWGLNEMSAARRLRPHLCFKLKAIPHNSARAISRKISRQKKA